MVFNGVRYITPNAMIPASNNFDKHSFIDIEDDGTDSRVLQFFHKNSFFIEAWTNHLVNPLIQACAAPQMRSRSLLAGHGKLKSASDV